MWVWLEIVSPLRGTSSNIISCHIFSALKVNTLKDTAKAPAVDILKLKSLNTVRVTKTAFFKKTNKYDEHQLPPPPPHVLSSVPRGNQSPSIIADFP